MVATTTSSRFLPSTSSAAISRSSSTSSPTTAIVFFSMTSPAAATNQLLYAARFLTGRHQSFYAQLLLQSHLSSASLSSPPFPSLHNRSPPYSSDQSHILGHKSSLLVSIFVTAQRWYLVAAAGLQIMWSLSLAVVDLYAILVKRSFRSYRVISLFAAGDGITSTLIFAAACASAGITVLIGNDLDSCAKNHCLQFETSTGMAFMTWFAALPSFLLNFWSLASR
ncbi:hypothetical protein KSS87_022180 [Heliosperma pusillum]|nr:hypothetical protein KSS87_022180 [Heliosperma pusillum]